MAAVASSDNTVFKCPICLQPISEAYLTKCGHSFCFKCIQYHLSKKETCPSCRSSLTLQQIFPNFALNQVMNSQLVSQEVASTLEKFRSSNGDQLDIVEINSLLSELSKQKRKIRLEDEGLDDTLCEEFLTKTLRDKRLEEERVQKSIAIVQADLEVLQKKKSPEPSAKRSKIDSVKSEDMDGGVPDVTRVSVATSWNDEEPQAAKSMLLQQSEKDDEKKKPRQSKKEILDDRRLRVFKHYEDLQNAYFESHQEAEGQGQGAGLKRFKTHIARVTRFSKFQVFARLSYESPGSSSTIVSSIEFDRDDEYFATAGVTKEIKMYEYQNLVEQSMVDVHSPMRVMSCRAKISCLCWNPYFKERIASSDYEGVVTCWNARTGDRIAMFEDHEKRAWSVDFSPMKPTLVASGSDDHQVIIWDTGLKHCVAKITAKANVCCVKFNPGSSNHIAFGSADHHIHYYDLRNLKRELCVFKGHAKAVSYVRFLNDVEMVSASTDSTLKLWKTDNYECKRTFTGHMNEKNFVGLSTSGEYIACGSENNSVYTYHKCLPNPVVSCNFSGTNGPKDQGPDETPFVSSVCWKKNANVLLAANSHGTINIMTLAK